MYGRVPIETTVVPGWLSQSARAIACVCAFGIIPILSIPGCSLDGFTIDESKLPPPRPPSFVFDLEFGSSGTGSGQFLLPTALSRDSANRIFVVDTSGDRILRFSRDGAFQIAFGSTGTGNEQLLSPSGIAIDGGDAVWVADQNNHLLKHFTADGTFLLAIGVMGTADGEIQFPRSVAIDGQGRLVVLDGETRVQIFQTSGAHVLTFGTPGSGAGALLDPAGLAIASDGSILVSDLERKEIVIYDAAGSFVRAIAQLTPGLSFPEFVTTGSTGEILVSDQQQDRVVRFSSEGTNLGSIGEDLESNVALSGPRGLTFDSQGDLFVVTSAPPRIKRLRFDPGIR